jgi:hypothetical protein
MKGDKYLELQKLTLESLFCSVSLAFSLIWVPETFSARDCNKDVMSREISK